MKKEYNQIVDKLHTKYPDLNFQEIEQCILFANPELYTHDIDLFNKRVTEYLRTHKQRVFALKGR